MSINETIIKAVTPIVPVCVPDAYRPDAGETPAEVYYTFNYTELPEGLGDNAAHLTRALVQVHYYAPLRKSTIKTRHALRDAIAAVDNFTLPSIENATDETGRWEAEDDGQS